MLGFGEKPEVEVEDKPIPEKPEEGVEPTNEPGKPEGSGEFSPEASEDESVKEEICADCVEEAGLSAEIEAAVDEIFDDLSVLLHGGTEEIESQKAEILNARVKIKRLFA